MKVALSLGGNLGDRLAHLRAARRRIAAIPGVQVLRSSPVYETEPIEVSPRYRSLAFLNAALLLDTDLDLRRLHERLRAIETAGGRRRGADRNAPRPIDIDIICADGVTLADGDLRVPHPRWAERRFVAQPLCDVWPDARLAGEPRTVREVLAGLAQDQGLTLFSRDWSKGIGP